MDRATLIHVELSDAERQMLIAALLRWGGPAAPTESPSTAMGFHGLPTFGQEFA
ncbi:hypothetical protein ABLG96_18710 [Nakamurella sp. A5-74]|uniref:Uncharacterized protein n=1 Tax=Nakamurella sp. A5-74 TaxID=3158264 RepID=A0AAU8DLS2_9ACTN